MDKWADYLISEVSYDSDHLISTAMRHQDTDKGITDGKPVDRLTIASDIQNGLLYITIYSGKNSWKKGCTIQTFSIAGNPYLRIDGNKAKLDYLGDLPEASIIKSDFADELESQPDPTTTPSPRGALPKESSEEEELPQALDLAPEPVITEPAEEKATPEQLARLEQLENQIQQLESQPDPTTTPSPRGALPKESSEEEELPQALDLAPEPVITEPAEEKATPGQLSDLQKQIDNLSNALSTKFNSLPDDTNLKQFSKDKDLDNEIEKLESTDTEHKIIQTLQQQNKKLDEIEKILRISPTSENNV